MISIVIIIYCYQPALLLLGSNSWKKTKNLAAITTTLVMLTIGFSASNTFAQEVSEEKRIEGDAIKNDPVAQKILKNIEIAKKQIEAIQEQYKKLAEQDEYYEKQRQLVEAQMMKDLEALQKQYEEYTPRNSFARFVNKVDPVFHDLYWDQFNYMEEKIKIAQAAKQSVLASGGSYQEAHAEYVKYASMPRVEMVKLMRDLNVKHGFADMRVQEIFDNDGKLERYEDDKEEAVCYGCQYINAEELLAKASEPDYGTIKFVSAEVKNDSVNIESPTDSTIKRLEDKVSILSKQLADEADVEKQQDIIESIERIVSLLEKLKQLD